MNMHRSSLFSPLGAMVLPLLLIILTGCSALSSPTETPVPPTATPVPPTATPVPPTDTPTQTPTDTPLPTDTPTSTPVPPTPDKTGTAAAAATATAAPIVEAVEAELANYDLTTEGGYLAWAESSFDIKTDTYGENRFYSPYEDIVVSDFVLQTEVTWETTTGFAGCGIVFRADGDLIESPQYRMYFIRLQGLPLWDFEYYKNDEFQSNVTGDVLSTSALDSKQGSTNRITLIMQGERMTAYGNGDRMSSAVDGRVVEGAIGFIAFQESGETTCTFDNTWVWALK